MWIPIDDERTVKKIYKDYNLAPDRMICMACNGGQRIPVSRKYDDMPYKDVFLEIATIVATKGIFIKVDAGPLPANFVHHYEVWPRSYAVELEINCGLESACSEQEQLFMKKTFEEIKELSVDFASKLARETRSKRMEYPDNPDTSTYWNGLTQERRLLLFRTNPEMQKAIETSSLDATKKSEGGCSLM